MREIVDLQAPHPPLRDPVLITAFAVRRRGGRLASQALTHVVGEWQAQLIAQVESEDYNDFTVRRPETRRTEERSRIEWPDTNVYLATPAGSEQDFLLIVGFEPNFGWKAYVDLLSKYVETLGIKTLICMRSFTGSVPHTRPSPVLINSTDIDLELQFGVQARASRYEGPTDVAGVLAAHGQTLGWRVLDLSVLQPYYFPRMPNAAATMALIKVIDHAFGTQTPLGTLPETAEEQSHTIDVGIADDAETKAAIVELERQYDVGAARMDFLAADEPDQPSLPSGDVVIQEIERLLREGGTASEEP